MAKKILVIDDEELVTGSVRKLLKKSGYEVEVANNGTNALERVKADDFDLIVSDIRIPEMDGIEIVNKIREYLEQNGKPSIPEILITGYADKEKYQNAVDLNVAAYINKPFDIKDFLEAVKGVLNEK